MMMTMEYPRSSGLRDRSLGKTSFQKELDSKLKNRRARGLSIEDSDDDSDDDGLGSDDELLAQFNATSRFANRSAKQRGSPGLRGSPSLVTKGYPAPEPSSSEAYGKKSSMTAEEILKQRQQASPPPKPQPRKGSSPHPDRPLTKEEIIFGGRRTEKDASEIPYSEEKKIWQPPSFLRNSSMKADEPTASPRLSSADDVGKYRKKERGDIRSPRLVDLKSRSRDDDRDKDIGSESPDPARNKTSEGKRASFAKDGASRSLRKQEAVQETPEPKSRRMKSMDKAEKPNPEPRSKASSTGSEVFKKEGRSTPKYMIPESDSEDSADEFLRRVKEHKVTISGRHTPEGRGTPSKDDRSTPSQVGRVKDDKRSLSVDSRKASDGRKSPRDGRKSPLDRNKSDHSSPQKDKEEGKRSKRKEEEKEEEPRRKSVFDALVGNAEDDQKKYRKRSDKTPSPAPRQRSSSAFDGARSPSPNSSPSVAEKPRAASRSRDDEATDRTRKSRTPPDAEPESSICDDVEEDPMKKKIEQSGSPIRKKSSKQTKERQQADDVINQVADLNEKETRTMQYIDPDAKDEKNDLKKVTKTDPKIVRPQPRYVMPDVSRKRPESARSYNSTAEIRESIYQDWYKERMKTAKAEALQRKQKEKEEQEKKEKEKEDKMAENKMAYEAWNKGKATWVKDKVREKKKKVEHEENKVKEKQEKQKEAEMAYKTWKETKDNKIHDQVKKKKKEEEKKKEAEEDEKEHRRKESADLYVSWKKRKDEKLINTHHERKKEKREQEKEEEERKRLKEEEAKSSYEKWLENSERRERRLTLRMSQSMEDLKSRPPWSPAKTLIGTRNCRIK